MNTTHTPGPWTVDGGYVMGGTPTNGEGLKTYALYVADCRISSAYRIHEEQQANARLIAAAPELLTGCEAALAYLADPPSVFPENRAAAVEIIRAALNKAKGIAS